MPREPVGPKGEPQAPKKAAPDEAPAQWQQNFKGPPPLQPVEPKGEPQTPEEKAVPEALRQEQQNFKGPPPSLLLCEAVGPKGAPLAVPGAGHLPPVPKASLLARGASSKTDGGSWSSGGSNPWHEEDGQRFTEDGMCTECYRPANAASGWTCQDCTAVLCCRPFPFASGATVGKRQSAD